MLIDYVISMSYKLPIAAAKSFGIRELSNLQANLFGPPAKSILARHNHYVLPFAFSLNQTRL